jgi:tRNA(Ile)-lysidine synthase TilS/MesJ
VNQIFADCVIMFSGGRDSTLAAVRLHAESKRLALVTVSSDHLTGIDRVHQRLYELKSILPPTTPWIHIIAPHSLSERGGGEAFTCLPCHRFYTLAGAITADKLGAKIIAFGYSGYQSNWPEQTPYAVHRLEQVLHHNNLDLMVPVYDIQSKDSAVRELATFNLSFDALEQKCLLAKTNATLSATSMVQSVDFSMAALQTMLQGRLKFDLSVASQLTLGSLG